MKFSENKKNVLYFDLSDFKENMKFKKNLPCSILSSLDLRILSTDIVQKLYETS